MSGSTRVVFRVLPTQKTDETPYAWKVTRAAKASTEIKRPLGAFRFQWQAILFARRNALHVFDNGGRAQVVIHGKDGQIKREWTYGDDPRRTPG